jgi:hypothetical protein
MRTAALAREMDAAFAAMAPDDFEKLVALGVPRRLLKRRMVGVTRIRPDCSGTFYDPDPHGAAYCISPVRVDDPITPESKCHAVAPLIGDIVDLVAWHEEAPQRWLLRTGAGEWLGAIEPQYMRPSRVRIWRSPLSWLKAGCVGLVPLGPERHVIRRILADCITGTDAEDERHRAELQAILDHPWPSPPVRVGAETCHAR